MKKHGRKVLIALVLVAAAWFAYRTAKGLAVVGKGHASPEDAIADGWMVYQRGITGWLETSPDGKTNVEHDTGWTGDPFTKA